MPAALVYSPAEAAWVLTRSEWFDARAAYYRASGIARDDGALPLVSGIGTIWARRITGLANARSWVDAPEYVLADPASDMPLALGDLVEVTEPPGTLYTPPARFDQRTLARIQDPPYTVPDPARAVFVSADADLAALPPPAVLPRGALLPHARLYPAEPLPRAVGVFSVRAQDVRLPHGRWLARRDRGPLVPDLSWRASNWGRAPSVVFVPPAVIGSANTSRADSIILETEDAVLTSLPHPFIPASAVERAVLEPGWIDAPPGTARAGQVQYKLARVRSMVVLTASGSGNGAQRLEPGWIGSHERSDPSLARQISREISRIDDNVARIAGAVVSGVTAAAQNVARGELTLDQIGAAVLAVALTGPAGLTLLGSDDPWRDATRIGALHYAIAWSPLTKSVREFADTRFGYGLAVQRAGGGAAAVPPVGQEFRPGLNDLSEPHFDVPGVGSVSASDIEAAEVVSEKMMVLDRDGAQALLVKIVEGNQYFGGYIDLVFARLVVEAETNEEKREALLERFTMKQALWWDKYGQHIARAMGFIMDVFAPALGSLLFSLAKALYEAAIRVQQLEVAARNQREAERADRLEVQRLDAEIAALERSMLESGIPIPTAPVIVIPGNYPPTTSPTALGVEPWYAPWTRYALREWTSSPAPPSIAPGAQAPARGGSKEGVKGAQGGK